MEDDKASASSGVPSESAAAVAEEETKKEEEPTTKNDTTKNDGASEAKVEQPSSGRAKRERKTVKAFNPEEFVEEKKEIEVPDGAGVKIEDMRKKFSFMYLYPVWHLVYVYKIRYYVLYNDNLSVAESCIFCYNLCILIHLLISIIVFLPY